MNQPSITETKLSEFLRKYKTRYRRTPAGLSFVLRRLFEEVQRGLPVQHAAYILATIGWETGFTFQPIKERRASPSKTPQLRVTQDRYWPTGYYGRGYIQLTWEVNYSRAGCELSGTHGGAAGVIGPDSFVKNPDLALQPSLALEIAIRGMREGWFTGRSLNTFTGKDGALDYVTARYVVNGNDHAENIAEHASAFAEMMEGWHATKEGER